MNPSLGFTQLLCVLLFIFPITLTAQDKANTATPVEKIPTEAFASLPDIRNVKLSPDGKHIASLARIDIEGKQGEALRILNVETGKKTHPIVADNQKFVINWIRWGNNSKVLMSAVFPAVRYGTPSKETRLLIVDTLTGEARSAIPRRVLNKFQEMPQIQDNIVDMLPDDDEHLLLQVRGKSIHDPSVYKIWLNKKKVKLVHRHKNDVYWWKTDRQHNIRLGYHKKDTSFKIIHRLPGEKKWSTLWDFDRFTTDEVWPLGFAKNPNHLYVNALHNGRDAIFRVDVTDPDLKKELVVHDDKYDLNGSLIYSRVTKEAVGITIQDGNGFYFWDKKYKALQKGINKALSDTDNYLISISDDEKKYVIHSSNDIDSGTYYFGDRDKKTIIPAAYSYSKLLPEQMSEKLRVNYDARDGLPIEAYVTLPKGKEKEGNLPTIIFPHGGPISYDSGGFDYWTQFFANRGYAVLQMNFRGSSGYGYDFMKAGLKNWGLAMQDDVEDGARWMIEKGYTDPDKICILGASYGGYAALMGPVKAQNLYKCAVSFAGVMDLSYLVRKSKRYSNYEIVKEQIGSKHKELKARSPVFNKDKISVPVLLIHGTKDRIVNVKHSTKMYNALKKAKKDVSYVELKNGTHYLDNGENRIAAFKAMETFLAKHLGN